MSRIASKSGFSWWVVRVCVCLAVFANLYCGGQATTGGPDLSAKEMEEWGRKYNVVFEKAHAAFSSRLYYKAIEGFTVALKFSHISNEERAALHRFRGNVYSQNLKFEEAINDYNEALRLNPNSGAQSGLKYARDELEKNRREQEEREVRRLAYEEKQAREEALEKEMQADPDKAIEHYSTVIKNANAEHWLAQNVYAREGHWGVKNRPTWQTKRAYYRRGIAYLAKRYYDRAIDDFDNVLKIDPKFTDAKSALDSAKIDKIAFGDAEFMNNPQLWGEIIRKIDDGKEYYFALRNKGGKTISENVTNAPNVKALYQKQEKERVARNKEHQERLKNEKPVGICKYCGRQVYSVRVLTSSYLSTTPNVGMFNLDFVTTCNTGGNHVLK